VLNGNNKEVDRLGNEAGEEHLRKLADDCANGEEHSRPVHEDFARKDYARILVELINRVADANISRDQAKRVAV